MYRRYAERRGWATDTLGAELTDLGGIKSATIAVRSRKADNPVWSRLKYEGGVHRVQRVPVTESQGRIHTSAAGVHALPEAEDVDIEIDPNDLRIDVFRSSGPGGQSVNTTDSAVRITHIPNRYGRVDAEREEPAAEPRSGMRVLRARLLPPRRNKPPQPPPDARRSQVRTVDRSERVRTYNFPENRISDHRVGYKAYNLDQVMDGALDDVIDALARADVEACWPGREVRPRRRHSSATAAGVASPRVDAELLLPTASASNGPRLSTVDVDCTGCGDSCSRSSSSGGRIASRCSTSWAVRRSATSTLPWAPGVNPAVRRPSCWSTPCRPWPRRRRSSTCAPDRAPSPWRWPPSDRARACTPSSARRMPCPGCGATPSPPASPVVEGDVADPMLLADLRGRTDAVGEQPALRPGRDGGRAGGARRSGRGRVRRCRTGWP